MPDFVGGDPESNANECPAVSVDPEPGTSCSAARPSPTRGHHELNGHIGKAEDESDVWLPARMAALIRQALDGYEQGGKAPASTPSPNCWPPRPAQ